MTIDLPEELVCQLRLRAVQDGRKLKDVAADLLRGGLAMVGTAAAPAAPVIRKDPKTGLPVILCRGTPTQPLTPERVARILSDR